VFVQSNLFFTDDFIGSKFAARQHASCHHSELQNVILLLIFVQFCFLFIGSFLSQNILKGYDPTSAGWKRALQGMAPPQFKDDWRMLTQFVADSVASVRRRDTQRAQEKYAGAEGWVDWVPVSDDQATNLLLDDQSTRCAMSAQVLTCVPLQFNTMR
jgi:hypothetical protein